jgi:hypothetical protein
MSRKAPNEHASETPIGKLATGNDGCIYQVVLRKDGTKYWKRTILVPGKYKIKSSKNKILVGEIYIDNGGPVFNVTDEFLKVLARKPKSIRSGKGLSQGNAYVFGKLYSTGYYLAGSHNNDGAQTGILNSANIKSDEFAKIHDFKLWKKLYFREKFKRWEDRTTLSEVRKTISNRILFVGDTDGGDVGANIFIHLDNGNIDSIIIDNNCIIPGI